MVPVAATLAASDALSQRTARMPSTSASPRRTASEKHTVRRTEVGTATSSITMDAPERWSLTAMPEAISPAPLTTTSMSPPQSN